MVSFKDLILLFYIWVLNITIEVTMKLVNLENILHLLLRVWLKNKTIAFKDTEALF